MIENHYYSCLLIKESFKFNLICKYLKFIIKNNHNIKY